MSSDYSNVCFEFYGVPWAITDAKLQEIEAVLARRLDGDREIPEGFVAAVSRNSAGRMDYTVDRGVAVVPVHGVLAKRGNLITNASGGVSTDILGSTLEKIVGESGIKAVVLDWSSPGGQVTGSTEVAETLFNLRGSKPIVSVANAQMASAAYWIGSAADEVVVTPSSFVGSIGVFRVHREESEAEKRAGIKTTIIKAGAYKAMGHPSFPLDAGARESMQAQADFMYAMFVDSVARNRGVSVETVIKKMADGREFMGQQAIDAGLADRMGSLESVIAQLAAGSFASKRTFSRGVAAMAESTTTTLESNGIPAETILEQQKREKEAAEKLKASSAPQLTQADIDAAVAKAVAEATASATAAEHERVTTINALCATAGMPDMAAKLIADKSTPQQAQKVLFAKLAAKNVALGDGGGRQEEKPADPDDKYRKEFRAHAQLYADMGIDEAGYIKTRRIDDGLERLQLAPAGK